ncbi:hypothetical protein HanRHA438_Chr12g0570671 [Helianthus annuus]|uniref:Uncharacterized protein n=1 Tax=Helianthus annuus TaxID=4232 RepID=A0A9K3MXK2_HELAN|nr:hypothetical protein HanXRQr2_Chr12g0559391 [Helianthus annuus]KAJ0490689.1 hypothetical protein HanHA300_Chr12g0458431 [Helianthus annuus]KAJ0494984.1 hypothetical protein HanIR_Chr12g0603731 [Helianthus annuus]KAJ0506610.1 hypothetical protein HanHA89_Chr12g0484031 [Helianthus annuus]KAJ0676284.1 hypothetical protein HanLR1_Chr12g0461001 [Helianthus annuus]
MLSLGNVVKILGYAHNPSLTRNYSRLPMKPCQIPFKGLENCC